MKIACSLTGLIDAKDHFDYTNEIITSAGGAFGGSI